MLNEHFRMIANSRRICFSNSRTWKIKLLKRHYKQMMPQPLQSHLSFCGFNMIYAIFHLLNFWQKEINGVHDASVLPFISFYMPYFNLSIVNMQAPNCFCSYFLHYTELFKKFKTIFFMALSHKSVHDCLPPSAGAPFTKNHRRSIRSAW